MLGRKSRFIKSIEGLCVMSERWTMVHSRFELLTESKDHVSRSLSKDG